MLLCRNAHCGRPQQQRRPAILSLLLGRIPDKGCARSAAMAAMRPTAVKVIREMKGIAGRHGAEFEAHTRGVIMFR